MGGPGRRLEDEAAEEEKVRHQALRANRIQSYSQKLPKLAVASSTWLKAKVGTSALLRRGAAAAKAAKVEATEKVANMVNRFERRIEEIGGEASCEENKNEMRRRKECEEECGPR